MRKKSFFTFIINLKAIREYEIDDESEPESDDEEYQQSVWGRTFTINYRIINKEVNLLNFFFTIFSITSGFNVHTSG